VTTLLNRSGLLFGIGVEDPQRDGRVDGVVLQPPLRPLG
jgi:hypothetical protein